MILPRGITGFWSVNTAPPPFLDKKAFCQMCCSVALENGGTVTELDTDTYSSSGSISHNFLLPFRLSVAGMYSQENSNEILAKINGFS